MKENAVSLAHGELRRRAVSVKNRERTGWGRENANEEEEGGEEE